MSSTNLIVIKKCPYCNEVVENYRGKPFEKSLAAYADTKVKHSQRYRTLFHIKCAYKDRGIETLRRISSQSVQNR